MSASRIVFVRHGQTDFNVERRFQGVVDRPLNEVGRGQARSAGAVLASRLGRESAQIGVGQVTASGGGVRVVCSPLSRARETAEILVAAFDEAGVACSRPVDDDRLIERAYGVFEGLTVDEIVVGHEAELGQWRSTGECALAGIEASDEVGRRVHEAACEAAGACEDGEALVVVSHGSAIVRGLVTFLGLDPLAFDGLRGLDNCHWSELVLAGGGGSGASGEARWRLAAHNVGHREDVLGA
ncbi:histidine phosphatase family protein [Actinomyces sp. B33]|uniref:histidine phosphatase family protein n=1 Tax=Actinomyces sp. B33 TaxID=2942131 RepID=UPI0023417A19|nr:histidine phosphatase family protein [Actinomyces sp. B33]MDC4233132.1 histidine phosphatase family protein [Actinomyces sp. B33]